MIAPLNPPLRSFRGVRAWVVGASSGIGAALAEALRVQGARVAVSARAAQGLCGDLTLPLDVRDADALRDAASQIEQAFGGLDLLVFCAGTYRPQRATAFDLDDALRHDDVNYRGALRTLDAALPLLLRQRSGHVMLVSSVAGWRGLPQALAYGPTKAALISLAETLYLDLRPAGIGVSVVNPGFVATPLTSRNTFRMPALIQPGQAALCMLRGLRRGSFDIHFPRRFTLWLRLLRILPYRVYFALARRVPEP